MVFGLGLGLTAVCLTLVGVTGLHPPLLLPLLVLALRELKQQQ
jgi:hypothetical protein